MRGKRSATGPAIGTLLLAVLTIGLNALLSQRLVLGEQALPPMGGFLSPQEGFWRNAEPKGEAPPASFSLRGLSAPVEVAWDASGIPHLFAANDTDLYRAQGWVVASQRLWQMDFIARAAAGRMSEVIGAKALDFDRAQRRKGMLIGAEASTAALLQDKAMAALLNAYADGVNQYIASLRPRDWPIEYKLLHHAPEAWSPFRSALIQQYMVESLSGHDRDVEDTHALAQLGPELFALIYPERPPGVVPTVPTDAPWPFQPKTVPAPLGYDSLSGFSIDAFRSDPANGSNNWAVHGSRTRNGHALLANDTHLGLNLPPIWFPLQLSAPGHSAFGFTLPGACGVVIGHNERCAWGVTNAPRDTRDWYRITWQDARKLAYRHGDAWLPVQWRVETIAVRGAGPVVDSIRMTVHGPVVFDERFGAEPDRHDLALRWLGHDASHTQRALVRMNRVRGHADYVEALRDFDTPAQNWVFASVDDTIAMRVQGRFPDKWPGQGRFVLDGADTAHRWHGLIPFAHTATQVNPARGFVSSANQHSVDEGYPYWFFNSHLEYYRNRSINRALARPRRFTAEDMMALQQSPYDLRAAEGLDALLPLLDTAGLDHHGLSALRLLRAWDRNSCFDGEEAALFQLWFDSARAEFWRPLAALRLTVGEPTPYNTIRILADSTLRATVERRLGTDARSAVRKAFAAMAQRRAAEDAIAWRDLNDARVTHLARLAPFGRDRLPIDGCGTCINAQRGNHGPSQRLVVELSAPPKAWIQLPGGVSGNPGSARYDDLLDEWATGQYREVLYLRDAADAHGRSSPLPITVLRP